ncbi:MAG: DUF7128 family protein [Terriglobia bacterium]
MTGVRAAGAARRVGLWSFVNRAAVSPNRTSRESIGTPVHSKTQLPELVPQEVMPPGRENPFCWYQCTVCSKIFDSESAQRAHEESCRSQEALLYSSSLFLSPWSEREI